MRKHLTEYIYNLSISDIPGQLSQKESVVILIDETIQERYGKLLNYPQIAIKAEEKNKQMSSVISIIRKLLNLSVDRSSCLIVIGGGILSDIGGFAASIYMRGIETIYIPTTLLSQVDASIGGKNGVNLDGYKNIIGTIRQPSKILFCADFLKTLPKSEFHCGIAEILKTFLLADRASYHECVRILTAFNARGMADTRLLSPFIMKSGEIKRKIIEDDPYEKGNRQILNLGHTFAHAIEKAEKISHGEAVSIGLILAAQLSVKLKFLSSEEYATIKNDLILLDMPIRCNHKPVSLIKYMIKDKKKTNNYINFILLKSIGEAFVFPIPIKNLNELLNDLS